MSDDGEATFSEAVREIARWRLILAAGKGALGTRWFWDLGPHPDAELGGCGLLRTRTRIQAKPAERRGMRAVA